MATKMRQERQPATAGLPKIDFMGPRRVALGLSLSLLLIAALSLFVQQLELGLDFTGGTLVEVQFQEAADLDTVRERLASSGYEGAQVVHFGSTRDVLIRLPAAQDDTIGARVLKDLQQDGVAMTLRRVEFVGPQVGEELREQGGLALLAALALVLLYVAFRFQLKFAVAAVVALFHDVVIVIGLFSVMRLEFDLTVLAALLAVIGYSLNDTIVVSDRIRENFRRRSALDPVASINLSLNQTLGRTLITSLTTLLVLMALLLAGGEQIRNFAMALSLGVLIGTYSSIYVAANMLLMMKITRKDLLVEDPGTKAG